MNYACLNGVYWRWHYFIYAFNCHIQNGRYFLRCFFFIFVYFSRFYSWPHTSYFLFIPGTISLYASFYYPNLDWIFSIPHKFLFLLWHRLHTLTKTFNSSIISAEQNIHKVHLIQLILSVYLYLNKNHQVFRTHSANFLKILPIDERFHNHFHI